MDKIKRELEYWMGCDCPEDQKVAGIFRTILWEYNYRFNDGGTIL